MNDNISNNLRSSKANYYLNPIIRWILFVGGFLFVGVGILGMFLPLLPTTIFFLLAAWCFARSSDRFYKWLYNNKLFGKYLRNYRSGNGITLQSKIFSIFFLWSGILASVIWATEVLYIRILLLAIAIGVTWHLLVIKTIKES